MIAGDQYPDLPFLLKGGNEESFALLYNQYWDKLYYLAFQKLRSQHAAEEIVQEVFLTLWKKREELEIKSLSSYLAAMVRHSVYRYLAKEKELKNREFIFHGRQPQSDRFDQHIENKLILKKILELSNQLPEKCRLVFQYNKLEDRSLKEVAKQLNISQKTAETHLTKALKIIRLSMRSLMHLFL